MPLSLKQWNERQKVLRRDLESGQNFDTAMPLFLEQHALVHSSDMVYCQFTSFADEIWENLTEQGFRRIPKIEDYSIAWVIWHIARIEDITMNLLVAGSPQLAYSDNWLARIKSPCSDTGNAMDRQAVTLLSSSVDIDALRAYRVAVGRRTREIVKTLNVEDLKRKVSPDRIQMIIDQGAVVPEAKGIVNYWSRRTVAGLLLMPPTRHNMVHVNQALRIKKRRG
jgi:hypothetical protein